MARKKKQDTPAEPPPVEAPRRRGRKSAAADTAPAPAEDTAPAEDPAPPAEPAPAEETAQAAEDAAPAPVDEAAPKRKRGRKARATEAEAPAAETEAAPADAPSGDTNSDDVLAAEFSAATEAPIVPGPDAAAESAPAEEAPPAIDEEELLRTLEALLFAAEEPLQPRELGRASGSDAATVRRILPRLNERYATERRAWELCEVAGGFRLMTRAEFFPAVQRLKTQTLQRKLTQAALETLALIAYRQPLSRAEIENVRGVGAGPVLRQLLERKLIRICGRGSGLGQPLLYGTTDVFLEHFGLGSIGDLPKPGELKNA